MQNIQPQENGEKAKVKVKVQVNASGIVSVSSATMVQRVSLNKSETTEINEIYSHDGSDDIDIEVGTTLDLFHNREFTNSKSQLMCYKCLSSFCYRYFLFQLLTRGCYIIYSIYYLFF